MRRLAFPRQVGLGQRGVAGRGLGGIGPRDVESAAEAVFECHVIVVRTAVEGGGNIYRIWVSVPLVSSCMCCVLGGVCAVRLSRRVPVRWCTRTAVSAVAAGVGSVVVQSAITIDARRMGRLQLCTCRIRVAKDAGLDEV